MSVEKLNKMVKVYKKTNEIKVTKVKLSFVRKVIIRLKYAFGVGTIKLDK